jgi:hypothetical protein
LVLLTGCLGGAYELLFKVWFRRVYRARGLAWRSSVVLHDSWCVVVLLKDIIQLTGVSGRLKPRKNGFGERFQVLGESGGAQIRLAVLS